MVTKRTIVTFTVAALFAISPNGWADDIQDIRNEIKEIRESYEARIKSLEDRLKAAETKAPEPQAQAPISKPAASATSFNPGIGMVLSGIYSNLQRDPASYNIGGFMPPGGDGIGPGKRGFSLSESELSFSANIDPYFYGQLTAALSGENTVSVEEAFFKTTSLPAGFSVKGGRFFSGIGYLNEVHSHAWDFVDQPLAYQAFLGGQYGQNGLQVKWLAPIPLFMEFGAEAGNGENFPGSSQGKNGLNGGAGFMHLGGDIGDSTTWRTGLSYLYNRVNDRQFTDQSGTFGGITNSFSGKSKLMIADAIFKWAPNGNKTETSVKVQAEYFRRRESGDIAFDVTGDPGVNPFAGSASAFSSAQSGWYVQGVYNFLSQWGVGLRYDQLSSGTPHIGLLGQTDPTTGTEINASDFSGLESYNPKRLSAMLAWSPTEFSLVRFQYAQDKARRDVTDNQFFLQYIYSLGAHGAHKY